MFSNTSLVFIFVFVYLYSEPGGGRLTHKMETINVQGSAKHVVAM